MRSTIHCFTIITLGSLLLGSLTACNSSATKEPKPAADATASSQGSSSQGADAGSSPSASGTSNAEAHGKAATPIQPSKTVEVSKANYDECLKQVANVKGRVVVVDIWSTSCLPCMKEFPHLVELARRWPEDVVCVSMNVDYLGLPKREPDSYLSPVSDFLKKVAADPPNMINLLSSEPDTDVLTKFEVESMPAILVFNRQGKQVAKLTVDSAGADGLTYAGDVVPVVEKLIEEL